MRILLAGCGYVGKAVAARLRQGGHRVLALTRTVESALELQEAGWEAWSGDLADAGFLRGLPAVDAVVHCASAGRGGNADDYRRVYVDGVGALAEALAPARLVFTSSTSVYAQVDGSWVTEESPADPDRETGRLLLTAENRVLAAGGTVLRLAGIYGPGRSVLLRQFLEGGAQIDVRPDPPATPEGRWINQIHRDDAAAAVVRVLELDLHGVFNVADHTPLTQRAIYAELGRRFPRPPVPERPPDPRRKRGWTHKRVSSRKLTAAGWEPRYRSWLQAVDEDADLVPSIMAQLRHGRRL